MQAQELLSALAPVDRRLLHLAVTLGNRSDVREVLRATDLSDDPPAVQWFVDAELANGEALSWQLLVYWAEGGWRIESGIDRVVSEGGFAEVRFEDRSADDSQLPATLMAAALELEAASGFGR